MTKEVATIFFSSSFKDEQLLQKDLIIFESLENTNVKK